MNKLNQINIGLFLNNQFFKLTGDSNYNHDNLDIPIRIQDIVNDGGVKLKDNVWMGNRVTVLGGVTINSGSIAGAGSVVSKDVAEI